jgi:hypothetical protein
MAYGSVIEDFFHRPDGSSPKRKRVDSVDEICGRLAPGELQGNPTTKTDDWKPGQTYETLLIGELEPGPKRVTFMARIVNIYDQPTAGRSPRAAKGCLKILAKDDTGCILVGILNSSLFLSIFCSALFSLLLSNRQLTCFQVTLWYADVEYDLSLGLLVSVWTPHVSDQKKDGPSCLVTSIFPERDAACHLLAYRRSDLGVMCKLPIGYREGYPFCGLDSLADSAQKSDRDFDLRVLAYVKAVGSIARCMPFVLCSGQWILLKSAALNQLPIPPGSLLKGSTLVSRTSHPKRY